MSWFVFPQIFGFVVFTHCVHWRNSIAPPLIYQKQSQSWLQDTMSSTAGFRFAFFMLAEYVYVFAMSSLTTVLFLGGWHAPFWLTFIPGIVWFLIKFAVVVFFLFWVRATYAANSCRSVDAVCMESFAPHRIG